MFKTILVLVLKYINKFLIANRSYCGWNLQQRGSVLWIMKLYANPIFIWTKSVNKNQSVINCGTGARATAYSQKNLSKKHLTNLQVHKTINSPMCTFPLLLFCRVLLAFWLPAIKASAENTTCRIVMSKHFLLYNMRAHSYLEHRATINFKSWFCHMLFWQLNWANQQFEYCRHQPISKSSKNHRDDDTQ